MTKQDITTLDLAIKALEAKPSYVFQNHDPQTSAKVIYMLKELRTRLDKRSLKIVSETEAQGFVRVFGEVYRACAGFPYKIDKKHFILATKLIKDHGAGEVLDKMELLAFHCRDGKLWFVKDGWANFTIETLSNRWNNILPQRRLSPEEQKNLNYQAELKKWEAHDAAINNALIRTGTKSDHHGVGTAPCAAG